MSSLLRISLPVLILLGGCATSQGPQALSADSPVATDDTAVSADAAEAAPTPRNLARTDPEAPELLEAMPAALGTFEFAHYRWFDDTADGFTLLYRNPRKHRLAEIFVYPVSRENSELPHETLVIGSTQATYNAIAEAVQAGMYANLNVLGAATKPRGVRTIARLEATYLMENLASYTLVYQTEHNGTMVKIRVSMPDNDSNRDSIEWDQFADQVFTIVERHVDDQLAYAQH